MHGDGLDVKQADLLRRLVHQSRASRDDFTVDEKAKPIGEDLVHGRKVVERRDGLVHRCDAIRPEIIYKRLVKGVINNRNVPTVAFVDSHGSSDIVRRIVIQLQTTISRELPCWKRTEQ